jgi:hypothetical protein
VPEGRWRHHVVAGRAVVGHQAVHHLVDGAVAADDDEALVVGGPRSGQFDGVVGAFGEGNVERWNRAQPLLDLGQRRPWSRWRSAD